MQIDSKRASNYSPNCAYMDKKSRSIFIKMVIFSILFLSVAMSIIFYSVNSLATGIVDSDTKNYLRSVTTEKKHQQEQTFQNLLRQNENLTRTPHLEYTITQDSQKDKKALRAFLKNVLQAGDGIYENVFIKFNRQILIDGINGASEGFSLNDKNFPDLFIVRETGEARLTHLQISPITGRQVFMLLSPIKSARNNQVIGVMATVIDLNNMAQKIIDQALVSSIDSHRKGVIADLISITETALTTLSIAKKNRRDTAIFYINDGKH